MADSANVYERVDSCNSWHISFDILSCLVGFHSGLRHLLAFGIRDTYSANNNIYTAQYNDTAPGNRKD